MAVKEMKDARGYNAGDLECGDGRFDFESLILVQERHRYCAIST